MVRTSAGRAAVTLLSIILGSSALAAAAGAVERPGNAAEGAAVVGSIVFIKDFNVWAMPADDPSAARPLTTDGTAAHPYSAPAADSAGTVYAVTEAGAGDIVRLDRNGRRSGPPFRPPGALDIIDRIDVSPDGAVLLYTSLSIFRTPIGPGSDVLSIVFLSNFTRANGSGDASVASPISGAYATWYDGREVVYDPNVPDNGSIDTFSTFPAGQPGGPLGQVGPSWFDTCRHSGNILNPFPDGCHIVVVPDIPDQSKDRLAAVQVREDVSNRPTGLRFWDLHGRPPAKPTLADCAWLARPRTGNVSQPSWSPDGRALAWDFVAATGEQPPAGAGIYLATGFERGCQEAIDGARLVVPGGSRPYWTAAALTGTPGSPSGAGVGYWMLEADGEVHAFGDAAALGGAPSRARAIDTLDDGSGYWILTEAGAVVAHGTARHLGDLAGVALEPGESPATIAGIGNGTGYWIFTDRGRAFAFGDARHHGDMAGVPLNGPVVASAVTPTGQGYWMVGSDGGIFSFGDARFHGSMGGIPLNQPVNGIAPDPDGAGYWLVAADGGIFAFDAPFRGSIPGVLAPGQVLNQPVVGAIAFGDGYLMVASDGGIFNFSSQPFLGSLGAAPPNSPVVGVAAFAMLEAR